MIYMNDDEIFKGINIDVLHNHLMLGVTASAILLLIVYC